MILTADDPIAKEAHYHGTCYRAYTLVIYTQPDINNKEVDEERYVVEDTIETVKQKLIELNNSPAIVQLTVSDIYVASLRGKEIEESRVVSLKKNLRRKLMSQGLTLLKSKYVILFIRIHFKFKMLSKSTCCYRC